MSTYTPRFLLTLVLLCCASTVQASELYSNEFSGATPLYRTDQSTGALTAIGPTGYDGIGDLTSDTRLATATVWGVRIASNELLQINPLTGAAHSPVTMNSPDSMTSIAFDVVTGKLYGNTSVGFGAPFDALYEIDPATGNSTFIGRILFDNVFALGFDQNGDLFGVADATNELIKISTTTGNGALVAALSVGLAFDIASRPEDNVMFLADSGTFSLYTVDTSSGNLTPVGSYGSATNIVGLAFSPVPEPTTLALGAIGLTLAGLLHRRRHRAQQEEQGCEYFFATDPRPLPARSSRRSPIGRRSNSAFTT
jgi:hypothetical protein